MNKKAFFFILNILYFLCFNACEEGPLDFKIISPEPNKIITSNFILELEGKSSTPITLVELKIGNKTINLPIGTDLKKPTRKWDIQINDFEDGKTLLSVTVKNLKNEIKTQSIPISIKKPDPDSISVQILSPNDGEEIKNNFILKAKILSQKPVVNYWIKHKNLTRWQQLPSNDKHEWEININDFEEGEQILSFTASNLKKSAPPSEIKIKIIKPLPVAKTIQIKILKPAEKEDLKENFILKLDIETQFALQNIWIRHNATQDKWIPLEINDKKTWELNINEFLEGKQYLYISAHNGKEYAYARVEINVIRKVPIDRGPGFGNCYEYHGNFGNIGSSNERFDKPYYIQISNDRRLFITDSRRNTVFVFSNDGKFLFTFGKRGTGPGEFDNPVGICIYKNEKIFVSDYLNRRVGIFDIKGNFIKFFYGRSLSEDEKFKLTGGVAVNDNGEVFVVDFEACVIFKFDTDGNFIKVFGKKGNNAGELNNPTGITISLDGFLYVTDKKNDRVVVFDTNGNFSFNFGKSGTAPGELSQPMGIAVDKYNHIYVSDTRNNRILKFNHRGAFICEVAKSLINPIGIAIDNHTGIVYVVDRDASLVKMFKPCRG